MKSMNLLRGAKSIALLLVLAFSIAGCTKKNVASTKVEEEILPFHENVVHGTLDNGMQYYIMKNESPEDKVELRLNVRSGSLDETDEERGLAHFVEHMAYNGTENFEGNEVIEFMEEAGLTFGQHTNAYTSFNNTNYQLSIPVDNKTLVDTAFFILRDWATGITFDKAEVDAEKGVILEEMRSRDTADKRMRDQSMQYSMAGSKYLDRDVIGLVDVLEGATPELLRGYYEKWYQPENMSIIVVGDINVEEIEALVKKYFAPIEKKATPEKASKVVPLTEGVRFAIISDEGATATSVSVSIMSKEDPLDTYSELKDYILGAGAMNMLNNRVATKISESRSNLISFSAGKRMGNPNMLTSAGFNIATTPETLNNDLESMLLEVESAKRFGFTPDELAQFLEAQRTQLDRSADPNFKYASSSYASGIVGYDNNGGHYTSFAQDKILINRIFDETNVTSYSNKFDQMLDQNNMLVTISVPTKDLDKITLDLAGFEAMLAKVEKAELVAETDVKSITSLIEKKPTAGKVVSRVKYDNVDGELITYNNGVRIFIKENDGTEKQFKFVGKKVGGTSILSDEDAINMNMLPSAINASGFTDISPRQLQRFLVGKDANVMATASDYTFDYSGGGSTEDIEITFQLLYKLFTSATVDENAYKAAIKTRRNALTKYENDRERLFNRELATKIYNDNYRRTYLLTTDLDGITKEEVLKLYQDNYLDVSNYTFIVSGDVDVEQVVELGATYLASLKSNKKMAGVKLHDVRFAKKEGSFEKNGQITNKSSVSVMYEGKNEAIENGEYYATITRRVLSQRLRERIREEIGGVYGVSARLYYSNYPEFARGLAISFTTDPERRYELIKEAKTIVDAIAKGDITQEELNTAVNQQNTALQSAEELDDFWINTIWGDLVRNDPVLSIDEITAIYSGIKLNDLNAFAKEFMSDMSVFTSSFNPEVANEKKN